MYLLDTNVVSELRKIRTGRADENVVAWSETAVPALQYLSAVSIFELEKGVLQMERRDAVQGSLLRRWLELQVHPAFAGRILPFDSVVATRCASLHVPDQKPERDSMIAATALVHAMIIVTRNVADFASSGVDIVNPWDPR